MKKLFISCPMKGRTDENIKKSMEQMHKLAEILCGEELEVIDSFIEENAPENSKAAVWYLGKSIQLLAQADYFVGVGYQDFWKGCAIERQVAASYNIKCYTVDTYELSSMADCVEIERGSVHGCIMPTYSCN